MKTRGLEQNVFQSCYQGVVKVAKHTVQSHGDFFRILVVHNVALLCVCGVRKISFEPEFGIIKSWKYLLADKNTL